jgi:signal transduction histidine kinase
MPGSGPGDRLVTTTDCDHRARWWNSLYWRVGLGFVVFVVALLVVQSAIFIYWVDRPGQAGPRQGQLRRVLLAAGDLGRAFEGGPTLGGGSDVAAVLRRHTEAGGPLYAVLADGTAVAASGGAVPDAVRQTALLMLGRARLTPGQPLTSGGPATYAPIVAGGVLKGLVIAAPPPISGFLREFTRVLSPQNFLLLLALTAIAALVLVGPARRRLAGLEAAALRVAGGDLDARAPDDGRDEVSMVARAFNRMGAELTARDASLQAADHSRRQLFADVSHELKTPLTAMRGYLETLQMDDGGLEPDRRRRYLGTVMDETLRLERIVADLVDLARVETHAGVLDVRVFAPARVFERVVRRHEHEALRRSIRITATVAPEADQLTGDPDRLEQVVENLVANALRYVADGGTIALAATATGDVASLTVADTGPGIAAEHVPHLFDRFYKADPARAAGAVGSGLGLSIVKGIVERHGGRVDVASRPGDTVFAVTLPQPADQRGPAPSAGQPVDADDQASANL